MAISPMGIINACDPRQAAREAFDVAGLIHSGPTGFCRDAACGLAAAVAEAFRPGVTIGDVINAAINYLHPISSAEIIRITREILDLAKGSGTYTTFRARYYESFLHPMAPDSRETFPVTIAILHLSQGKTDTAIRMAANFGRDADTIATMVGSVVGAFHGAAGVPSEWVAKVEGSHATDYRSLAKQLAEVVLAREAETRARLAKLAALTDGSTTP